MKTKSATAKKAKKGQKSTPKKLSKAARDIIRKLKNQLGELDKLEKELKDL